MTPEQMVVAAELLEKAEIQHRQDTGYGNSTVRAIAQSLRRGSLSSAQAEWYNDGDKVHTYPNLTDALTQILGCRLHHVHQCQSWICKKFR